jgi:hypothetical protein
MLRRKTDPPFVRVPVIDRIGRIPVPALVDSSLAPDFGYGFSQDRPLVIHHFADARYPKPSSATPSARVRASSPSAASTSACAIAPRSPGRSSGVGDSDRPAEKVYEVVIVECDGKAGRVYRADQRRLERRHGRAESTSIMCVTRRFREFRHGLTSTLTVASDRVWPPLLFYAEANAHRPERNDCRLAHPNGAGRSAKPTWSISVDPAGAGGRRRIARCQRTPSG